jgi:hypothetical protein
VTVKVMDSAGAGVADGSEAIEATNGVRRAAVSTGAVVSASIAAGASSD